MSKTKHFTVIGFYRDTGQRFAGDYEARTGDSAERQATKEHRTLSVVGVIAGEHATCESETQVNLDGLP